MPNPFQQAQDFLALHPGLQQALERYNGYVDDVRRAVSDLYHSTYGNYPPKWALDSLSLDELNAVAEMIRAEVSRVCMAMVPVGKDLEAALRRLSETMAYFIEKNAILENEGLDLRREAKEYELEQWEFRRVQCKARPIHGHPRRPQPTRRTLRCNNYRQTA